MINRVSLSLYSTEKKLEQKHFFEKNVLLRLWYYVILFIMNTFVQKVGENSIVLENKNSLDCYSRWPAPTIIFVDGPYGINGFPGDPKDTKFLPEIYEHENIEFYSKYFQIISKIAHPTIQIFYGILNKSENNINTNMEIVLEYIPSDFDEVQVFIKKCLIGNNINYLIINKISEVLAYIYECGYPYLMLYPDNIKFNNKFFKQYFQVDEDSTYLYTINKNYFSDPSKIFNNNFMKIINIGTLKYKNPI
jgi:hypothetical protein